MNNVRPIRQRMIEDMQLHGYSARTQTSYLGAVRGLARHYRRSPEEISQEEGVVLQQSGIKKEASIHTLRHSYATHLLERGVLTANLYDFMLDFNRNFSHSCFQTNMHDD